MGEIAKWYANRDIFITGGTGLVGKSLVEKLLRDCPDIGTIYIMIRAKKGVSSMQRAIDYKNNIALSNLREQQPHTLDKLHFIEGDLLASNLKMANTDRQMIAKNVSIIFHVAADVKFDQSLHDAYNTNVAGTKALLEFATEFKQLDTFLFVSTAFSQSNDIGQLKEKFYPSCIEPELISRIMYNVDPDTLDALSHKILGKYPNTYAFSKSICEQLVYDYKDKFPTAIARPSIISLAWKEPHIGYTEGIQGLNGWAMATGRGVLRSMHCNENYPCNMVPNDVVVNGIILLAYECGKRHQNRLNSSTVPTDKKGINSPQTTVETNEPLFFNITQSPLSWKQYVEGLIPNFFHTPYDYAIWRPGGSFKQNRFHNFICVALFQLLPAIIIDTMLVLMRFKPILLRVQRRIISGCQSLDYYMNTVFIFNTELYNESYGKLNNYDREKFYDASGISIYQYLRSGAHGARLYLMKEKIEDIPKARRTFKFLWLLDVITKLLLIYWILKRIFHYFNVTLV